MTSSHLSHRRVTAVALAATAAFTVVATASPALAAKPSPSTKSPTTTKSTVSIRTGVQYTTDGGKAQALDVYSPAKKGSGRRAVVFVHGGAWSGGLRTEWAADAKAVAAAGWVGFAIDYRLDSPTPYTSEPADVRAAVEWVQRNAQTYGVDPARIAIVGASSGGHLAALEATIGTGSPGMTGRVKAVVSWSGPMDMPAVTSEYGCYDVACQLDGQWLGAAAQQFEGGCLAPDCADRWAATSPVQQVDPTDPPMLLVNSTQEMVPLEQLQEMSAALTAAGVPVTTQVYDGTKHAQGYHDTAWPTTFAFLDATV